MTSTLLHATALIIYIAAAVLYGANLAIRSRTNLRNARIAHVLAVAIHTAAIGAFCIQTHQSPFASSFGTLSVASWTVALIYIPVEFLEELPALGVLATPAAALLMFAGFLRSGAAASESVEVRTRIISSHVLIVLISFAMFALAACCAVFYLWQYGVLKHPDRRALYRKLPPLETVDSVAFHLVAFALPLLTVGLALGIVRAIATTAGAGWLLDPHTIVSFVVWLVYGTYLAARLLAGWRGTRLNYLLIAGVLVTLVIYFLPSQTHRFAG